MGKSLVFKGGVMAVLGALGALSMYSSTAMAGEPCSFYVKGMAGYGLSNNVKTSGNAVPTSEYASSAYTAPTTTSPIKDTFKNPKGFVGGLGVGYYVTQDLRTDVELSVSRLHKTYSAVATPTTSSARYSYGKLDYNNTSLMANGYYDFNTSTSFTPYVTLGMGMTRAKAKIANLQVWNGTTSVTPVAYGNTGHAINAAATSGAWVLAATLPSPVVSKNTNAFAYQGGAGVAFEMTKGVFFDLGYRIGNGGEARFKKALASIGDMPTTITTSVAQTGTNDPKFRAKANVVQNVVASVRFAF